MGGVVGRGTLLTRRGRFGPARAAALLVALAAAAALAGTYLGGFRPFSAGAARGQLASFTDHDVQVRIAMERDAAGHAWLTGRFTPTRAGFHLYAKDLPRQGIHGIGRPTLLEVAGPAGVRAGALRADRAAAKLSVPLLGLDFPVYPAGPVTLRLPVQYAGPTPAELSVTYMACSERTCLAPAIDHRVRVSLPSP